MVFVRDIANETGGTATGPDAEISSVHHASGECVPGGLFVAIRGAKTDGHGYIPAARAAGAAAVMSELPPPAAADCPWIQVADVRLAMARAAALVSGHPSRALRLVGVTGTNGKTTFAYLMDAIFREAFERSAMIGTIECRINADAQPAHHTTPEAPEIQRFLRRAVDAGCSHAVMEVTSIGIDLHRASALTFDTAVFTNLTQDHLDYHGTMENYFDAKRRLFDGRLAPQPRVVVLNRDDPYGERMFRDIPGTKIGYGIEGADRDVAAEGYVTDGRGTRLEVRTPGGRLDLVSPMIGRPHVYNILAAAAAAIALDIAPRAIAAGVARAAVPGRFERVDDGGRGITVVVDYAHTPDAVANVTATARGVVAPHEGRVITVFGCGGDRDRTKRPLMAAAAAAASDFVVATSDNPRSESPEAILDDVEKGLKPGGTPYRRIADRAEAIAFALSQARRGDIVVIAGKGHETYQILGDRTIDFDDRAVARAVLASLNGSEVAHAN